MSFQHYVQFCEADRGFVGDSYSRIDRKGGKRKNRGSVSRCIEGNESRMGNKK